MNLFIIHKKLDLLISIICFFSTSFSQDVLFYKDGKKEDVKISEINSSEVTFKKFVNLTGPNYIVRKAEIDSIRFENGTLEKMSVYSKKADLVIDSLLIRNIAHKDVQIHYRGYRDEMKKVVVGTVFLTPLFGMYLSKKIQSSIPVKNSEITYLVKNSSSNNSIYEKNPHIDNELYVENYINEANTMHKNKIKKSFILGSIISLATAFYASMIILNF